MTSTWDRDKLRAFLDEGKVVVFSGELFRPWLPGAVGTTQYDIRANGGIGTVTLAEHEILGDLTPEGFGPGLVSANHNETPPGAEALAPLTDGHAVLHVDRASTAGTVLATTLNPIQHCHRPESTIASRFPGLFLPWVVNELL